MGIQGIKGFVAISRYLATAGQPSEPQIREIAREGFEVIINLGFLDSRYCLQDEAGLVRPLGLEYRHISVVFNAPAREDLQTFFEAMEECQGKRVFVHCAANRSRISFPATLAS